jgi:hypothetical protein
MSLGVGFLNKRCPQLLPTSLSATTAACQTDIFTQQLTVINCVLILHLIEDLQNASEEKLRAMSNRRGEPDTGSWSSTNTVFQDPSKNSRTMYTPAALEICCIVVLSDELTSTVQDCGTSSSLQIKSCL